MEYEIFDITEERLINDNISPNEILSRVISLVNHLKPIIIPTIKEAISKYENERYSENQIIYIISKSTYEYFDDIIEFEWHELINRPENMIIEITEEKKFELYNQLNEINEKYYINHLKLYLSLAEEFMVNDMFEAFENSPEIHNDENMQNGVYEKIKREWKFYKNRNYIVNLAFRLNKNK